MITRYSSFKRTARRISLTIMLGILIGMMLWIHYYWLPEYSTPASEAPVNQDTILSEAASETIGESLPARIVIPAVQVSAQIVPTLLTDAGWEVANLGNNVGHLEKTPALHESGNIVLAGHIEHGDGSRGVFADLKNLVINDVVIVLQGENERHYQVSAVKTVAFDDLSVLYPTGEDQITLITCAGYDFLSATYRQRVVVVARRIR